MADSVKPKPVEVEIEGESYALDKIPSENSGVVRVEKEKLLGVIDLKALVSDLGRVGGFIRIAYNGVGAAGYEHTKEQIEIQQLGYDITKLCDKSALTVAKFKKASSGIVTNLRCTYGYLLDNLEGMGLETLSSISKLAGEMEKTALELHHDFVAQEKKVITTLENTQNAKKIEASKIEEEKKRRIKLEEDIQHEQELIKDHQEKEKEAEARRRSIEQQEDKGISEIGAPVIKSLVNAFTTYYIGLKVFEADDPEIKATKLRQNRLDALEAEMAIREKRLEALASMSAFTTKLRQCSNDQEMAECAVEALHEAIGALKHLSAMIMQAALFWKQMQDHCHSLADSEMQSQVERAMKYSEDKRLKVWTSYSFKHQAIQFYSGWVALNSVCAVYMEQLKATQQYLHKCITENPTYEESKRILPDLAEKFMADLKRDQKALEEKDFKAKEEILVLNPAKGQ